MCNCRPFVSVVADFKSVLTAYERTDTIHNLYPRTSSLTRLNSPLHHLSNRLRSYVGPVCFDCPKGQLITLTMLLCFIACPGM